MQNTLAFQLSQQFREVYLEGSWISTNYKVQLQDVGHKEAFSKTGNHNTIALLTFHINYYLSGVLDALMHGSLNIKDKYSFDIHDNMIPDDWKDLKRELISNAEKMSTIIAGMSDKEIMEPFIDEKYGNNYKNIHGLIEHGYYHLGQLVLIKKLLRDKR